MQLLLCNLWAYNFKLQAVKEKEISVENRKTNITKNDRKILSLNHCIKQDRMALF